MIKIDNCGDRGESERPPRVIQGLIDDKIMAVIGAMIVIMCLKALNCGDVRIWI